LLQEKKVLEARINNLREGRYHKLVIIEGIEVSLDGEMIGII
jgi:hypothetical protein